MLHLFVWLGLRPSRAAGRRVLGGIDASHRHLCLYEKYQKESEQLKQLSRRVLRRAIAVPFL